jgi:hypothetical protein
MAGQMKFENSSGKFGRSVQKCSIVGTDVEALDFLCTRDKNRSNHMSIGEMFCRCDHLSAVTGHEVGSPLHISFLMIGG